tara:strand:- start:630 stop:1181 length:552 start_codon:yes stop_codon:yes gene_type:complete
MVKVENNTPKLILVSGPTRGGKSKWAENLLKDCTDVVYIASSESDNSESWLNRITEHRLRRPSHWNLIEGSIDIIQSINSLTDNTSILIDSLGGYIAKFINCKQEDWIKIESKFIKCISNKQSLIVIVIEETGWGVVPSTNLGNIFRDRLGSCAQKLQEFSDQSWLVIQGRAINLRDISVKVE